MCKKVVKNEDWLVVLVALVILGFFLALGNAIYKSYIEISKLNQ